MNRNAPKLKGIKRQTGERYKEVRNKALAGGVYTITDATAIPMAIAFHV